MSFSVNTCELDYDRSSGDNGRDKAAGNGSQRVNKEAWVNSNDKNQGKGTGGQKVNSVDAGIIIYTVCKAPEGHIDLPLPSHLHLFIAQFSFHASNASTC